MESLSRDSHPRMARAAQIDNPWIHWGHWPKARAGAGVPIDPGFDINPSPIDPGFDVNKPRVLKA